MGLGSSRHTYADAYCNGDGKRNSNVHTNGYCYGHCDSDDYSYCHRHSYFYRNGYCYGHSYCDSHRYTDGNA